MTRSTRRGAGLTIPVVAVLVGLALGFALASCGGGHNRMAYERIDQRKQEIHMLWAQIRAWRQDAGLKGVEPPRGEIIKMHGKSIDLAKRVCPMDTEPSTPRCQDVCSLAGAICENAESICRIADELEGDSWAQDKCSSAKASCKEAKQECCRCRRGEGSSE
jgi:hypothetical protein